MVKLQVAIRAVKAVSNLVGDAGISAVFLPLPPHRLSKKKSQINRSKGFHLQERDLKVVRVMAIS